MDQINFSAKENADRTRKGVKEAIKKAKQQTASADETQTKDVKSASMPLKKAA